MGECWKGIELVRGCKSIQFENLVQIRPETMAHEPTESNENLRHCPAEA